jgi:hypothetical protein
MIRIAFLAASLALPTALDDLPVNPDVTQATIADTICKTGWTRTVRPYVAAMQAIKRDMLREIGEPIENRNRYELDHAIPLALGGAVIDRRNLVLQPWPEARQKDAIETCLSSAVCRGVVSLADAQEAIWRDWRKAGEICER